MALDIVLTGWRCPFSAHDAPRVLIIGRFGWTHKVRRRQTVRPIVIVIIGLERITQLFGGVEHGRALD
eukprot:3120138-Prymnesium_polylepis.1